MKREKRLFIEFQLEFKICKQMNLNGLFIHLFSFFIHFYRKVLYNAIFMLGYDLSIRKTIVLKVIFDFLLE